MFGRFAVQGATLRGVEAVPVDVEVVVGSGMPAFCIVGMPDAAVQEARERGMLLDASFGRRTKSVLLMDTDHVILSSVTPETIAARMEEKNAEETSVQP